jgi:thiamine biosynthesis protein ThiS
MKLTVNGKPVELPDGSTVAGLLAALSVEPARVAVERNQDVVPRRTWAEAHLVDGDHVEIVTFVGGG